MTNANNAKTAQNALTFEDLAPYQLYGVNHIVENKKCALWIGMGLGKTITTLTAIDYLLCNNEAERVLIIAPLKVCLTVWPSEIKKWEHVNHLKVTQLAGQRHNIRQSRLDSGSIFNTQITIINREMVPWLVEQMGDFWPFDMIIIDESSSFKNWTAKRSKALRSVYSKTKRMVQLTGTPAGNGLMDIYSQIHLLDRGHRLGKTLWQYKQKYFDSDFMGYNYTLKLGAEEKIYRKLERLCLSMKTRDFVSLPDCYKNNIFVDLPKGARKIYKEVETDFYSDLENGTVEALNAAVKINKLLQIASGAVYLPDMVEEIHAEKLKALEGLVEEQQGDPLLVAYNYRHEADRIKQAIPDAVDLGDVSPTLLEGVIDRWNEGKIPVMLAHPASAGHGLNLARGGHTLCWFSLSWSLELYEQFNARLDRIGQDHTVAIHHILANDTADLVVLEALAKKTSGQTGLLQALKADIKKRGAR